MKDSPLPTDLVLLLQITKNAQMFWDHLSLQLLCNVACEQKRNASAEMRHPKQRSRADAQFARADHVPAAGRQPLSLLETPVRQTPVL